MADIGAFSIDEFCATYGIRRTFFYREINSGRLKAVKAGTKTLILKSEAARWARALPKLEPDPEKKRPIR